MVPTGAMVAVLEGMPASFAAWRLRPIVRGSSGHERQILDLMLSPDQQPLITAGRDNRIRVWRLSDLSPVAMLEGVDSRT